MKYCNRCSEDYKDSYSHCSICGTILVDIKSSSFEKNYQRELKQKKISSALLLAAVSINLLQSLLIIDSSGLSEKLGHFFGSCIGGAIISSGVSYVLYKLIKTQTYLLVFSIVFLLASILL